MFHEDLWIYPSHIVLTKGRRIERKKDSYRKCFLRFKMTTWLSMKHWRVNTSLNEPNYSDTRVFLVPRSCSWKIRWVTEIESYNKTQRKSRLLLLKRWSRISLRRLHLLYVKNHLFCQKNNINCYTLFQGTILWYFLGL